MEPREESLPFSSYGSVAVPRPFYAFAKRKTKKIAKRENKTNKNARKKMKKKHAQFAASVNSPDS